jgi:lysophospholipase L1-like esterase
MVKSGKASIRTVSDIVLIVIIGVLIAYPFTDWLYDRFMAEKLVEFHPYLQLTPPAYVPVKQETGKPLVKILCLGGSTTEFTDSNGLGWPEYAQRMIQPVMPDSEVQVYNLGRQWYTTLHTLIDYETNLRRHRPNVIIAMHGVNDLMQNADFSYFSMGPFREDYGHFLGPIYRMVTCPGAVCNMDMVAGMMWYAPTRLIIETDRFPGLAPFERNIKTMADLAKNDGTTVILATQPYLIKENMTQKEKDALIMVNRESIGRTKRWSYKTALSGIRQYNDKIRQIARERDLLLIDVEPLVPKTLEYFIDDVHFSDKGFKVVSEAIGDQLKKFVEEGKLTRAGKAGR